MSGAKTRLLPLLLLLSPLSALALPKVTLLATGGTIAGKGESATEAAYKPGVIKVETLIDSVPALKNVAEIKGVQVANIASQDMDDATWIKLAKTINDACAANDGFVITHGTDTLEETAYFLSLTVKCAKPVVITGAMRPPTALSADGPLNLYNAVVTAVDAQSKKRGVLVVMNDTILDARDVTKTSTTQVQSFASPNFGALGYVYGGKVTYQRSAESRQTVQTPFDVAKLTALPKVGIVYSYVGASDLPAKALLANHYEGIVSAGVGNGNVDQPILQTLAKAAQKGVVVVRATRVPTGAVTRNNEIDDDKYQFVAAETLSPQKARILLQLALTKTKDPQKIQGFFERY